MPDEEEECLVAFLISKDSNSGYAYSLATYLNNKFYSWGFGGVRNKLTTVSYWMPLPEEPKNA